MIELPESDDPRDWLRVIDEVEAELVRAIEWHASREIDGEAATIRRALDTALGEGSPLLLELGLGQVLELGAGEGER